MDNRTSTKSWIRSCYDIIQRLIYEINELGAFVNEQSIQRLYTKLSELEATTAQGIRFIHEIFLNTEKEQGTEKHRSEEKEGASFFTPYPPNTVVAIRRDSPHDDEWMLAIVISFNPITLQYLVEDYSEDEEDHSNGPLSNNEDSQDRRRFIVSPHRAKPVPESDSLALKKQVFPQNHTVLALYPSTTVLYKAIVVGTPAINSSPAYQMTHFNTNYQVQFDNDIVDGIVPTRNVPARYVLDLQIDSPVALEDVARSS